MGLLLVPLLGAAPGERAAAHHPKPPIHPPASVSESDSLELSIAAPASVRRGEPVRFTLTAANRLDRALTLYLRGREIAFDLIVRAADGTARWHRLGGAGIPAIIKVEQLGPRGELRLRAVWDQRDDQGRPVGPGEYRVEGLLLTDGPPLRAGPVSFRIGP